MANESTRLAAEKPATASVPKPFTILMSSMCPNATRLCWIPLGRPIFMLRTKVSRSNESPRNENRT
ncbi:MAG: hypothetical protein BWX71_01928 [Deltaproteobacteria bacterium ADurb.Bin072]|nr:MAG: hypothetical protein BWX71_01928 [Deltaproteobacteria bacterium ADurb.Bin072]